MFQQENHSHHEKLATTGKQNILFSSLTPDKANNSCLTLRRNEKETTLNYGNELLIS